MRKPPPVRYRLSTRLPPARTSHSVAVHIRHRIMENVLARERYNRLTVGGGDSAFSRANLRRWEATWDSNSSRHHRHTDACDCERFTAPAMEGASMRRKRKNKAVSRSYGFRKEHTRSRSSRHFDTSMREKGKKTTKNRALCIHVRTYIYRLLLTAVVPEISDRTGNSSTPPAIDIRNARHLFTNEKALTSGRLSGNLICP